MIWLSKLLLLLIRGNCIWFYYSFTLYNSITILYSCLRLCCLFLFIAYKLVYIFLSTYKQISQLLQVFFFIVNHYLFLELLTLLRLCKLLLIVFRLEIRIILILILKLLINLLEICWIIKSFDISTLISNNLKSLFWLKITNNFFKCQQLMWALMFWTFISLC